MKITIHRGIDQIGGCITEIESSKGTKILIDLGHNLPDGESVAHDLYDEKSNIETLLDGVSHIFYSHYHSDHIGFESKVPDKIQQHIGSLSLKMIRNLREHMTYADSLKEEAYKSLSALERFDEYESNKRKVYGDIAITPLPVSHSAIDAHMFFIECDGKTILHTGDFRDNGYNGKEMFEEIKSYISQSIDILITEGTLLSRNNPKMITEYQLKEKAEQLLNKYKYAFVLCSSMDADRLCSFFKASHDRDTKRRIIADSYQVKQIITVKKNIHKKPYKDIFAYPYERYRNNELNLMKENGFLMFVRHSETFEKYIDNTIKTLNINPKDIVFIYSKFSGYINKNHKAYNSSLYKFINRYNWNIEQLHTSGHASKEALTEICNTTNPNYAIIPIHKEGKGSMSLLELKTHCPIIEETTKIKDIEIIIK